MIALLDTSHNLRTCEEEIGCKVEQLLTPLTRFRPQQPDGHFAIDNGAFAGFKAEPFLAILEREKSRQSFCRWVACPDVVGSARRTLEVFDHWGNRLRDGGWKVALVAQDGLESIGIPWGMVDAIFIGGSTEWKLGTHAANVVRAAKMLGKWVHAGRVNTPGRFEYFEQLGADSIDGTGLSRYSWMRERIYNSQRNPKLWDELEAEARP